MKDFQRAVNDVRELYRSAEHLIKVVEDRRGELVIPAINELRYAGFHVLQGLSADEADPEEQFRRARRHCQRAGYDAVDGGIVYCLDQISKFKGDYRRLVIPQIVPRYPDLMQRAQRAKDFIDGVRAENKSREAYYEEAQLVLPDIFDVVDELEANREELNKALQKQNHELFRTWLSISIAALALLVATVTVFVN